MRNFCKNYDKVFFGKHACEQVKCAFKLEKAVGKIELDI